MFDRTESIPLACQRDFDDCVSGLAGGRNKMNNLSKLPRWVWFIAASALALYGFRLGSSGLSYLLSTVFHQDVQSDQVETVLLILIMLAWLTKSPDASSLAILVLVFRLHHLLPTTVFKAARAFSTFSR